MFFWINSKAILFITFGEFCTGLAVFQGRRSFADTNGFYFFFAIQFMYIFDSTFT